MELITKHTKLAQMNKLYETQVTMTFLQAATSKEKALESALLFALEATDTHCKRVEVTELKTLREVTERGYDPNRVPWSLGQKGDLTKPRVQEYFCRPMECLHSLDECAIFRCSCGHEFHVDAAFQENTTLVYQTVGNGLLRQVQIQQCPDCQYLRKEHLNMNRNKI
jgi:hypothetical protein